MIKKIIFLSLFIFLFNTFTLANFVECESDGDCSGNQFCMHRFNFFDRWIFSQCEDKQFSKKSCQTNSDCSNQESCLISFDDEGKDLSSWCETIPELAQQRLNEQEQMKLSPEWILSEHVKKRSAEVPNSIVLNVPAVGNGMSPQRMVVNAGSLIATDNEGASFTINNEAETGFEFLGGEQGDPPPVWVENDNEYELARNDADNFYKSRFLHYSLICKSLGCGVKNKPSYINVVNTTQKDGQCSYELEYDEDAPEDAEFTLEFWHDADCKFEVRNQDNSALVNFEVADMANARAMQIYSFKSLYTGVVPKNNGLGNNQQSSSNPSQSHSSSMSNNSSQSSQSNNSQGSSSSVGQNNSSQNSKNSQVVDLELLSLKVQDHEINPNFSSENLYYFVDLVANFNNIEIEAVPKDSSNEVLISLPANIMSQNYRDRMAYVDVVSADRKARKTYSIVFNKKEDKNYLLSLSTKLGKTHPQFDKYKNNYQIDLSHRKDLFLNENSAQAILESISFVPENSSDLVNLKIVNFSRGNLATVLVSLSSNDQLRSNQYYLTFYGNERMWYW